MNGNYDRPGSPANNQQNRNNNWNNTNNNNGGNNNGGSNNWNNGNNRNNNNGSSNWNNSSTGNTGNSNNWNSSIEGSDQYDVLAPLPPDRNVTESRAWVERLLREHPEFVTPPQQSFDSDEMLGSIQNILAKNIGNYVVVEFLIGTDRIHRKQGQIFHVGTSYITLYDDENANFLLCDIFSVKFVYFFVPNQRPNRNFNLLPTNNGGIG
ncbi:MAG: hypothetical protein J1E40_08345 [Oscillospiraceae bacterium]|nr:hypothetical protein [Oscillospiraceae bacterium]